MMERGPKAGESAWLRFLENDGPIFRLTVPYLNRLANHSARVIGISQDGDVSVPIQSDAA